MTKREIALLGILIVLGGIYLGYHFVFLPLNTKTAQLQTENNTLTKDSQTLQQKGANKVDVGLEEQKIRDDYAKMNVKIPSSPLIPDVYTYVELCARESKVKLLTINYKENAAAKTATTAPETGSSSEAAQSANCQISASGSHFNLLSFLLKIENAPRIYIMNGIKVTVAKSKLPAKELSANTPEQVASNVEKESQSFDLNNVVINLDFAAYFDNTVLPAPSQKAVTSKVSSVEKTLQTTSEKASSPSQEVNIQKLPAPEEKEDSGFIIKVAAIANRFKGYGLKFAGNVDSLATKTSKKVVEKSGVLSEYNKLVSEDLNIIYQHVLKISEQHKMDPDLITLLPEGSDHYIKRAMQSSDF
jgi:Tfp pilus assembly protein PilO